MFNRRRFLDFISTVPGLGILAATLGAAPKAKAVTRDYFRELGVKPFINAAGTYTALTSSLMPAEVSAKPGNTPPATMCGSLNSRMPWARGLPN
ncbi:MAG: hypothetical protein U5J83_14990 [Bryobacterales bacterium]|nr:hypothetical protein [Bryobacterales bacterium]